MQVLNLKSTPNWNSNPRNLYCGRENRTYGLAESVHHNPFPLKKEAERGSTLIKYKEYLREQLSSDLIYRAQVMCLDSVADNLMCWCKPHPCHCDILKSEWALLNAFGRPATYAGIGSRDTPELVLQQMGSIGGFLAMLGYKLRSGGAVGADSAFHVGSMTQKTGFNGGFTNDQDEIFLPWNGFNGMYHGQRGGLLITDPVLLREASEIAKRFHPAWHRLNDAARKLMTRNTFQILGPDLRSPTNFVVCWTKDGGPTGGTGQAIRIAQAIGIPVYNLFNAADVAALLEVMRMPK